MKLVKKLVSAVAALAMTTSAFVGLTAFAEGPTVTATATVAEDKSTVSVQVDISGCTPTAAAAKGNKTAQINLAVDSTIFDLDAYQAAYEETCEEDLSTFVDEGYASTGLTATKLGSSQLQFTVPNTIIYAFFSTKNTTGATLQGTQDNVITFVIPVKDASKLPGYEFTITGATVGEYEQNQGTLTVVQASIPNEAPQVTKYAVTAGTGIASVGVEEAAEGDTVNFTVAEAPANKQLADIKVNGTSIGKEATSFTMPAEAATVTAVFEDIMYTVTGANGITLDKSTAKFGETVSITEIAIPVDKELVDITLNGVSKGANFSTFLMPAENVTVTAVLQDKVVEPDPVVTFEGDRVTANNAVGFWSKLSAFENAGTVKAAGFVFANVEEVGKELETSQIQVADTLDLGQTITYEFKNLTGFDKFGLKGLAYIVTDKGAFWSNTYFGDGLLTIAR